MITRTPLIIFVCMLPSICFGWTILIDPGHGGEELGAIAKVWIKKANGEKKQVNIYEKNLCLSLAKMVQANLKKDYTTYLTRSMDRTVSLDKRADMAEKVKADLFISIHFNSSKNKLFHGFETYYLDNHKNVAIQKVEKVENDALMGDDKVVNQILIDLVIQQTVSTSKKLASFVHKRVSKNIKIPFSMKDRGVKPGLFYVLALSKRPGVLIEAGFMSNPSEIWKIKTPKFLNAYAKSISEGIVNYLKQRSPKEVPLF